MSADKLHWGWGQGAYYAVSYAPTGRAKCHLLHCKQPIAKGELRVGVFVDLDGAMADHCGNQLGLYHPSCLVRSFAFKSMANPPVEDVGELQGFDDLKSNDQELIRRIVVERAAVPANDGAVAGGALSGKLTFATDTKDGGKERVVVGGSTFAVKDQLRRVGGRWDAAAKAWTFDDTAKLKAWLGVANVPSAFDLRQLPAAEASAEVAAESASNPKPKPQPKAKRAAKKARKERDASSSSDDDDSTEGD